MWFVFTSFKIMNVCLESHLEVTGGGLWPKEAALEATRSGASQQALLCSQPQRAKWVWASLEGMRGQLH